MPRNFTASTSGTEIALYRSGGDDEDKSGNKLKPRDSETGG